MDQRINRNGAEIDKELVENAIAIESEYKAHLMNRARELTGLPNLIPMAQLKAGLEKRRERNLRAWIRRRWLHC